MKWSDEPGRTLWSRLVDTDEELEQIRVLRVIYDRVQDQLRRESLIERVRLGMELEFSKLIVNGCLHPAKMSIYTSEHDSKMQCLLCGATVTALVAYQTGAPSEDTFVVVYQHSTPVIPGNFYIQGNAVSIASNSGYAGNYVIAQTQVNTQYTVSSMVVRRENEV